MSKVLVGVIMGSTSDWEVMRECCRVLEDLGIPYEKRVLSAHRTPNETAAYAGSAINRGIEVIVAGAGGAAHLPGIVAAHTVLPVIGVPVKTTAFNGLDSLLSIVQMPKEIPVATVSIDRAGAVNAALLAAEILGIKYSEVQQRLTARRAMIKEQVLEITEMKEYDSP